jgi:hypothetical protein
MALGKEDKPDKVRVFCYSIFEVVFRDRVKPLDEGQAGSIAPTYLKITAMYSAMIV